MATYRNRSSLISLRMLLLHWNREVPTGWFAKSDIVGRRGERTETLFRVWHIVILLTTKLWNVFIPICESNFTLWKLPRMCQSWQQLEWRLQGNRGRGEHGSMILDCTIRPDKESSGKKRDGTIATNSSGPNNEEEGRKLFYLTYSNKHNTELYISKTSVGRLPLTCAAIAASEPPRINDAPKRRHKGPRL